MPSIFHVHSLPLFFTLKKISQSVEDEREKTRRVQLAARHDE